MNLTTAPVAPKIPQGRLYDGSPIPFGKFRGSKMTNVPLDYLRWFVENCHTSKWHAAITDYMAAKEPFDERGPAGT